MGELWRETAWPRQLWPFRREERLLRPDPRLLAFRARRSPLQFPNPEFCRRAR